MTKSEMKSYILATYSNMQQRIMLAELEFVHKRPYRFNGQKLAFKDGKYSITPA